MKHRQLAFEFIDRERRRRTHRALLENVLLLIALRALPDRKIALEEACAMAEELYSAFHKLCGCNAPFDFGSEGINEAQSSH